MSIVVGEETQQDALLRALKQPLYDTWEAPADGATAVPLASFFQIPPGQPMNVSGNTKSLAETNMQAAGLLGDPMQFALMGYQFNILYDDGYFESAGSGSLAANFAADMTETYEGSVFKFFVSNERMITRIPLSRIPNGPFFLSGPGDVAIDDQKFYAITNGEPVRGEFQKFLTNNKPEMLDSEETFSARIEWPLGNYGLSVDGAGSRLTVILQGVLFTSL